MDGLCREEATAMKYAIITPVIGKKYGCLKYSETALLWSLMGLGKSDLNSEVTILPKLIPYSFHYGELFGTEQE